MAKAPTAVKTASVLAFERKLATSDAVMYSGSWQGNQWQPIRIQEKAVRGTISNRLKNALTNDPAKLDAEIQKANLQRVDVASLPADADTLKVKFTLRVLGNLSTPSVCNDRAYQDELQQVIDGYITEHGFAELARRYATNLANGRFLWRNRVGAEKIIVNVTGSKSWTFDAYNYALRDFTASVEPKRTGAGNRKRAQRWRVCSPERRSAGAPRCRTGDFPVAGAGPGQQQQQESPVVSGRQRCGHALAENRECHSNY
jgi:CRISPR-associated protein Csy3